MAQDGNHCCLCHNCLVAAGTQVLAARAGVYSCCCSLGAADCTREGAGLYPALGGPAASSVGEVPLASAKEGLGLVVAAARIAEEGDRVGFTTEADNLPGCNWVEIVSAGIIVNVVVA